MTATPLTRLPDPTGPNLGNGFENAWTYGLAINPAGTHLAQTYLTLSRIMAGYPSELAVYLRTGDAWVRGTVPARPAEHGPPVNVAWTPDGRYLACTTGSDYTTATNLNVWTYAATPSGLALAGRGPTSVAVTGAGFATNTTIAFSGDGRWLAAASTTAFSGLLAHDGAGGLTAGPSFAAIDAGAQTCWSVAWNPADPTVLAVVDYYGRLHVVRVSAAGGFTVLGRFDANVHLGAIWHPSGKMLLAAAALNCAGLTLAGYAWPSGTELGALSAYAGCITGFDFSADGALLAGGYLLGSDTNGALSPNGYAGLTVAAINPDSGPAAAYGADWPGYLAYDRLTDPDQIAGNINTWAAPAGGGQLLVSSSFPGAGGALDLANELSPSRWGFHTYRAGGRTSLLFQRDNTGAFHNVGTNARPLGMAMPDGTRRVWPAAPEPLYMCMPDGTWRKVI